MWWQWYLAVGFGFSLSTMLISQMYGKYITKYGIPTAIVVWVIVTLTYPFFVVRWILGEIYGYGYETKL